MDIDEIDNKDEKLQIIKEKNELEYRVKLAAELNDASIDPIIAINDQTELIACNAACSILWNVDKNKILGQLLSKIFPEFYHCEEISNGIKKALQGFKYFVPANKANYGKGYFEHHFIPLKNADEHITGVLVIIHDVAHRIKAENDLRQLNKSLARKNKEIKQRNDEILLFSKITAHDLKEPLRKMYIFIDMMLMQEALNLSDQGKENFKRIQNAANRMTLLTDDIMTFAQLNSVETTKETVDLNDVFTIIQQQFKSQIKATGAVVISDELPLITGYQKMIIQLFQHILVNAVKFQKNGSIPRVYITASIVRGEDISHPDAMDDVNYQQVSITDNGIGIDMQYSEKIFQMFQRLHTTEYTGTGLGLALCKKIVELHHGFITVDSLPDAGSSFKCYFPLNPC